HVLRQVHAGQALRQRPQQRAAQTGSAAQVQRVRELPAGESLHQDLGRVVAQRLHQVRVELSCIAVEQRLHVLAWRVRRRGGALQARQVVLQQFRVATACQRLPIRRGGFLPAPQLTQRHAAVHPHGGGTRIGRDGAVEQVQRWRRATQLRERRRAQRQRLRIARFLRERFLQQRQRLGGAAQLQANGAQVGQR